MGQDYLRHCKVRRTQHIFSFMGTFWMLCLNELSRVFRSSFPEMPAFQFLPKPSKVTEISEEGTERLLWCWGCCVEGSQGSLRSVITDGTAFPANKLCLFCKLFCRTSETSQTSLSGWGVATKAAGKTRGTQHCPGQCNSCVTSCASEKWTGAENLDASGVPEKLEPNRIWAQLKHTD